MATSEQEDKRGYWMAELNAKEGSEPVQVRRKEGGGYVVYSIGVPDAWPLSSWKLQERISTPSCSECLTEHWSPECPE